MTVRKTAATATVTRDGDGEGGDDGDGEEEDDAAKMWTTMAIGVTVSGVTKEHVDGARQAASGAMFIVDNSGGSASEHVYEGEESGRGRPSAGAAAGERGQRRAQSGKAGPGRSAAVRPVSQKGAKGGMQCTASTTKGALPDVPKHPKHPKEPTGPSQARVIIYKGPHPLIGGWDNCK